MRSLFRRYAQLTASQKRAYSLLTVITVFALLLYCLGISSLLIRFRLVRDVRGEIPPTLTPTSTLAPTVIVSPEHTPTPSATLPPTPTQRPIPTYTPTPTITPTLQIITRTVFVTATPGVLTTVVISVTVTPTPVLTPTVTITDEASLSLPLLANLPALTPTEVRPLSGVQVLGWSQVGPLGEDIGRAVRRDTPVLGRGAGRAVSRSG